MLLILLVVFVVVMVVWLLMLTGTIVGNDRWLAFIACAILGAVVFLVGSGVIVVERPVVR